MDGNSDLTRLQDLVKWAYDKDRPLLIAGHGSKSRYVRIKNGDLIQTSDHKGIVEYQPAELVIGARTGTPISELQAVLAENGQMLASDPPMFGQRGTVGGAIACGYSGPARPWRGSLRDAVLGVECINGLGEVLNFGGRVMKNVAGFDVSRLHCGAMGTLGLITSVNLRVQPKAMNERTFRMSVDWPKAWEILKQSLSQSISITGTSYHENELVLRLSGSDATINSGLKALPEYQEVANDYWSELRDHALSFFSEATELTRAWLTRGVSPNLYEDNQPLVEWAGAQTWYQHKPKDESTVKDAGSLTCFSNPESTLESKYTKRIRSAFDPKQVFNRELQI